MAVPARLVREAKELLATKDVSGITARALADAAHEGGKSLGETLKLVAALASGGQGEGPAPEGRAAAESDAD